MTQPERKNAASSPQDQTLDAAALDRTPSRPAAPPCHIRFVEGSQTVGGSQMQTLLRSRLRSAALVLFAGSALFYLWGLAAVELEYGGFDYLREERRLLRWCHLAHMAGLAIFAAMLWRRCDFALRTLRFMELGIFGLTTTFFVNAQHFDILYTVTRLHYIPSTVGLWFSLIFIYAIYIPNSWRRAALIIGLMLAAAAGGFTFDVWRFAQVAELAELHAPFGPMALLTIVAYGASVYGTYLINTLRQQALEARELGQYRLKRLLGAGGMGEVYLAEHRMLKRPCALKLIRAGKADDPRTLARFEREVQTIATLSHWNTVEIFDYGSTDDGTFYYVMEYLPGLSIADLVERYGPLPAERVAYLLEQVCDALNEAHSVGLVHRDVKPGNIFAAIRGGVYDVAKLLDFGLVKSSVTQPSDTNLTLDGTITGSPLYMSPEQAMGESEPDARSDIYGLGAVAYFMLLGRPPFEGDKPIKVLFAHANEPVTPPTRLRDDVPADLEEIILRCLAKRPEHRYPDTASLAAALRNCECWGQWNRERATRWWRTQGRDVVESAVS